MNKCLPLLAITELLIKCQFYQVTLNPLDNIYYLHIYKDVTLKKNEREDDILEN